jgi:hypothetical protein
VTDYRREATAMELKLELVPIPVRDIDRAKAFYADNLGFNVDLDVQPTSAVRVVQLTPPGSACSICLTRGLPALDGEPGTTGGPERPVACTSSSTTSPRPASISSTTASTSMMSSSSAGCTMT